MALGYLTVIIPILFTGTAMTIQSWMYFWRERNFRNGAVAGWNTFADVYNVYHAIRDIPDCFSILENAFSRESDEDGEIGGILLLIVIAIVVLAITGGIVLTSVIIRRTARGAAKEHKERIRVAGGLREEYA
jgi:hypothetical protein